MTTHLPTFTEQSAAFFFKTFFVLIKTMFVALLLTVAVLVTGQSRVAPVSVNLLTTYAMEYAVNCFKPYRGYFPQPYLVQLDIK